jgi:hypothetical protein
VYLKHEYGDTAKKGAVESALKACIVGQKSKYFFFFTNSLGILELETRIPKTPVGKKEKVILEESQVRIHRQEVSAAAELRDGGMCVVSGKYIVHSSAELNEIYVFGICSHVVPKADINKVTR